MRKILIAGNWKMNSSVSMVNELITGVVAGAKNLSTVEAAVCPPYLYIPMVAEATKDSNVSVGSQNVSTQASGAFTGEISTDMIKNFSCKYSIIGHSERRTLYNETDALVAEKFKVVKASGLIPIFCIGETLEEREANETESVVARQLDAVSNLNGNDAFSGCVIAYEPVWAIGTGKTASPEQAQSVHAFIRQHISKLNSDNAEKVQILYGGSMNPGNAKDLLSQNDIDGGLIGGASLKSDDFMAICQAGNKQ
ncbi:MAG: triose-phosphate isomerase [Pseudomonadota bacterium]